MKKVITKLHKFLGFLSIITAVHAFPVHAQSCFIETSSYNPTFPYLCLGDSFKVIIYSSYQLDSMIINWGDNTQSHYSNPITFATYMHYYQQPGYYYPYLQVWSSFCTDSIVPFNSWSSWSQQDTLNYVYVGNYSCTTISGKAFVDMDNNCVFSTGDFVLRYQSINYFDPLTNQNFNSFTDHNGNYSMIVPQPIASTPHINLSTNISGHIPACGTTNVSGNVFSSNTNYDFIFNCTNATDLSITSTTSLLAQTVDRGICFVVYNNSCNPYNNATITFSLTNDIIVNGSLPAIVYYANGGYANLIPNISGNTVTLSPINISPLSYVSGCIYVKANPSTTTLGDTVCYSVSVSNTGDINPSNNTANVCATVVTSYDPNDKNGTANNRNAHGFILPNEDITYTIRFQNTGNFPARDVRIVDTLSNYLDVNSITVLGSSHPVRVQLVDNVLTFFFDEIWLPDSVSDANGSQGHVSFRIKQNNDLPAGTVITNFVDIYFDYNPPVRTNAVVSQIPNTSSIEGMGNDNALSLYPNPAKDKFYIMMAEHSSYLVKIIDVAGNVISSKLVNQQFIEEDISNYSDGIYFVSIQSEKVNKTLKLIVTK
jgi:uncharacterized repeat protein (TIGR01451 family)